MNNTISVIIPTYNRAHCIGNTIESVLNQTYKNIEVIVTDNASQDATKEVVHQYSKDIRIKYYRNNSNIGATRNVNQALMQFATGKYVIILSDDDVLIDREYFEKAIRLFDASKDMVLVFANLQEVDLITKKVIKQVKMPIEGSIIDGTWVWLNYCKQNLFCPLLTTIFLRSIAINIGGWYRNIPSIDMLLFLCMLLHGKAGFISNIVANYGIHSNNHFKRIKNAGDIKILYEDLDFIKLAAQYALDVGVKSDVVDEWRSRMLRTRIKDNILFLSVTEDKKSTLLDNYYMLLKQSQEFEYFLQALIEIGISKHKNQG